jgi:subtilisin family serine protease
MNHEEFIGQLVPGYDYYDNDSYPQASGNNNHGNACAGIIAAKGNNGLGIVGLAYNCKIMPLRINNYMSGWDENKLKDAINLAKDAGADVISISLQSITAVDKVIDAINNAVTYGRNGKGCIVVVSAGNAGDIGQLMYPAQYTNSFSVGATDHNDLRWGYSCKGNA